MANYSSSSTSVETLSGDGVNSDSADATNSDSSGFHSPNYLGSLDGSIISNDGEWFSISQSAPSLDFLGKEQVLLGTDQFASIRKPIDAFRIMVSDDILDILVTETNRYGGEMNQNFIETNRIELVKFLALVDYMGIVELPEISLYWSKNPLYSLTLPRTIMSRDRFLSLLRYFHISNNQEPNRGRLSKIQPLLDVLIANFQGVLEPGERIVVDESLVPWRGRLIFRQYMPGKRHKYGIKLFKLCIPEGYTLNILIYAGKGSCPKVESKEPIGISGNYVLALTQPYLNQGRKVYIDNWYTSIPLAQELLTYNTVCTGTIRANRKGLPQEIIKTKLKKGETIGLENRHGVQIVKWRSNRDVITLSTDRTHSENLIDTGNCDRTGIRVLKPKSIIDYNKAKQGIDLSDQYNSYYTPRRKGSKWWRKLAFEFLLGTAITNSWLLFNKYFNKDKKISLLNFKESILTSYFEIERANTPAVPISGRGNTTNPHFLKNFIGQARVSRRRCVNCYQIIQAKLGSRFASARALKVRTYCAGCKKQPAMCFTCFERLH